MYVYYQLKAKPIVYITHSRILIGIQNKFSYTTNNKKNNN